MSSVNGKCPHGHQLVFIDREDGYRQAIGGQVQEGPFKERFCPLCEESGWKGVPFKEPVLKPAGLVTSIVPLTAVLSKPECIFNYCPTLSKCEKEGCQSPSKEDTK